MPIAGEPVLVTGGAGYIGSHAVLALQGAGARPVVLDDLSTGFAEAVPASVPLVIARTDDRGAVLATLREHHITSVMHFAARLVVPESVTDPLGYYTNNVSGTLSLLGAAVDAGVKRFVLSSSASVYGEPAVCPIPEGARLAPMSPYGASKVMTERILTDTAAAHGLAVAALRYFNVAGADPAGRAGQRSRAATHLIKVACEVAVGRRSHLDIFGADYPTRDGTCVRDYVHVSDVARAHIAVLRRLFEDETPMLLNCGYGAGHSVMEVVRAVEKVSGRRVPVQLRDRRPGDPAALVADATALRVATGWVPRYADLDIAVRTALAWEMSLSSPAAQPEAASQNRRQTSR